ncbi:MAG: Ig-like domain repeat protein [Lachnospiraceae bacterium]|nr:Ig-like domain repeat protein [Lachnospiraceae bacterium]
MITWKEKPFSRVVALMLALLLAVGTLPTSPYRANAVDTGPDATFKLVYDNAGSEADVIVSGKYSLSNGNPEKDIVGDFEDGRFTITGFTEGTTYTLKVNLSYTYVYDGSEGIYFTAPAEMVFDSENNPLTTGSTYSLYCGTVSSVQITGKVTTPGANEGDPAVPLNEAKVTVSKDGDIESVTCLSTDENGSYTIALPEALIGKEVSVTAEKSGYVKKTENLTVPADTDFSTISLEPISVTFSVGVGGSVTYGEQTITSESGDLTIYPNPGTVSFTVSPENDYQIASVTKAFDTLSPGVADYSFDIENEKVAVSVSFIRKDTHGPVIAFIKGEGDTYYGLPDANNESWGNGNATQCMISISDPVGIDELTQETEYVSGPAKLFMCLGTVDDAASAKANAESSGVVISLTENQTAESVLVSAGQGYTFVVTDNDNNPSNLIKATFKQDTIAPTVSSASISCTEGHSFDSAVTNAYVSDSAMTLSIQAQDSPAGVAGAKLYGKEPGTADYTYEVEMNPVENAPGAFTIELGFDTLTELAIELWDKAGNHTGKLPISSLDGIDRDLVLVKTNSAVTVSATANNESVTTADNPNFKEEPDYEFTVWDENNGIVVSIKINGVEISERTDSYNSGAGISLTEDEKDAFVEGENTIAVTCKNTAGIISVSSYRFMLDKTAPSVTEFRLTPAEGKMLNTDSTGTFANGPIAVTVTGVDPFPTGVTANSGLKSISLFINGTLYGSQDVENGKVSFTLDPSTLAVTADIVLSATATDVAGNTTGTPVVLKKKEEVGGVENGNSNISTDMFTFDIKAPEITISNPLKLTSEETATAHYTGEGENQKAWYSEDIRWKISRADDVSGIASVQVQLNDENPTEKDVTEDGFYINAVATSDGSAKITVTVTDKAGNTESVTKTVYIDKLAPTIKSFLIEGNGGQVYSDAQNTFANGPVNVTVTAEDPLAEGATANAGVSTVSLYVNEDFFETKSVVNGQAVFTLDPAQMTVLTDIELSAIAKDYAGNVTVSAVKLSKKDGENGNSNIYTDTFSFDTKAPEITISDPVKLSNDENATVRYTGEGDEKKSWYSETIRWKVSLADDVAGIATVEVRLNGTKLDTAFEGTEITASLGSFSVSSEAVAADCSSVITVTVTDKAGNAYTVTKTVYIDMFAPAIKGFLVEGDGVAMYSDEEGNYTNGPVKITVTAEDPGVDGQNTGAASMPVSGIESISLYIDGDEKPFATSAPDADGKCVFSVFSEVSEDFFETHAVTVEATDRSGLKSGRIPLANGSNDGFSSGRIVIENRKPGAVITLSDTGRKMIDDKTWYGADTEVKIQATDAESGLASIAVTVNGVAITADDSANPQAIGAFASKEKSSPVYVINTANHTASDDKYTIHVTVTDVSGNTYETETTFYIDRTAPAITEFTVTTENAADTISSLSFGTFANGRLRVIITVQDAASSAGLDFVALTVNDGTPIVAKLANGVAEFILPEEVVEGIYDAYSLKATAVDVYGHASETKTYERQIQIDTVKPVVSVSAEGPNPMAKDGVNWYSSDVTWTIRLQDANAGIASATVNVNGTVITTDANGRSISELLAPTEAGSVKDVTFYVLSSQGAANADGSYTITVEATDYIGNKSEIFSGTVYVDKAAPVITNYAFLREGAVVSPLSAADLGYVYFFEQDATVVISASDVANGYGLKTISYYMEDFNGVKTAEQTVTPDASGNVTIAVKAPFRGKIYAKATDGVNNESGYVASAGFAAESKTNHDEMPGITLERNETELRQPNGVDLYSGNVEIKLNIADEIVGIKAVEWSIAAPYDQAKNQTGSVTIGIDGTISADGWAITGRDGNLVTGLSRTITVTHDSNDITVRVRMTDWAGNQTERSIVFGIDKTVPTVEYSFDNTTGDRDNPNIFNEERTLTITVTERNFVPGEFALNIHNAYGSVPAISQWTEERDVQDPNNSTYTATVTFTYDGSYTVGLGYADRAGNRAAIEAIPAFVIDQSRPLVLVSYDNKKPVEDIYFDNFRTATVTVTEKNFDVSRVTFTGNAPRTGSWTANGDEHTLIIYYDEDGDYSFGISVTDKAGNVSVPYDEENFIIDTTAPELDLSGLLAANRGEVAPVITYTDANYLPDGVSILLMRQSGEIISKPYTLEDIVEDGEVKGYRVVFKNFDPMKENDDIYTISISAVDHAGNRTKEIMRRFSVNRFGSTYIMDGAERMNRVNTNNPTDLSVLEINVDEINSADVEIFVIRNSSPKKLEQGVDYVMEEVKSEDVEWKEYRYTIKNTAFMEDGEYTIRIISTDKAGNVNENDENGKNGTISFCVDRIAPNIVVVSPVDEESYKEDTHRAVIEVRDNYLLDSVKIYLNDKEVSYAHSGYQYTFDIPQDDTKQSLRIVATDAAGNVSEVTVKDFLVSTNMFVRFLNTPWAAVTFFVILFAVGGGVILLLARKRRR